MLASRNHSKYGRLIPLILLVATLVWASNTPWKNKPFQQWDNKDLQEIFTLSPWVQITTIQRTWLPVPEMDVPPQQEIAGGIRQAPPPTNDADDRASETSLRQLDVYFYWDSSKVMRAASAREAVLHGAIKESEVEKYMQAPQQEYQVVLHMADMTPFLRNDEKFFQAHSFLEMKRSKLKLSSSQVVYQRDGNGKIKDVIFYFPKKTSSGVPTITPDETDVQFFCTIANSKLRVDFKPKKMVDQFGRDL